MRIKTVLITATILLLLMKFSVMSQAVNAVANIVGGIQTLQSNLESHDA